MLRSYEPMTMLALVVGALLAHAAGAPAQEALPPAAELIDRYVAEVGGRDAILARDNSRATGRFEMPAAGIQGTMIVQSASGRTLTEIEIPGIGRIRSGYDGEVAWSIDPNLGTRVLEGRESESMRENANPLSAVRDVSLFSVRETVELTEMGGEACYRVRLVWNSGRETFDCYSVDTGLLVGQVSTQESPMGAIETVSLLSDYQEAGGLLMPRRMEQRAFGQVQLVVIDTLEYGVVSPDAFELPDAIRTLLQAEASR